MKQLAFVFLLALTTSVFSQEMFQGKFSVTGKSIEGVWISTGNGALIGDIKYAIYTDKDKLYMAIIASEVYTVFPLEKKEIDNKTRYYDSRPNSSDYYILSPGGLDVFDSQGYIDTYKYGNLEGPFNVNKVTTIGVWLFPDYTESGEDAKIVLYSDMEHYYMAEIYPGGPAIYPLEKKVTTLETRYYDKLSSEGDYFVIGSAGLKYYDTNGYIITFEKSSL